MTLEKSEFQADLDPSVYSNQTNGFVYRCTVSCPIGKKCFIIKTDETLPQAISVLLKCPATRDEIKVTIGTSKPP